MEAVRGHHPRVLDANATEAKLVEPRLHGDDVAFLERSGGRLAQRRLFQD